MITTITINDLRNVSILFYQISMIIDQHCSSIRIFARQKKRWITFCCLLHCEAKNDQKEISCALWICTMILFTFLSFNRKRGKKKLFFEGLRKILKVQQQPIYRAPRHRRFDFVLTHKDGKIRSAQTSVRIWTDGQTDFSRGSTSKMRTIFLSGLFLVLCQLTQSTDLTRELNKVLSGSLDLTKESYFQAFVPYQLKVLRYYVLLLF